MTERRRRGRWCREQRPRPQLRPGWKLRVQGPLLSRQYACYRRMPRPSQPVSAEGGREGPWGLPRGCDGLYCPCTPWYCPCTALKSSLLEGIGCWEGLADSQESAESRLAALLEAPRDEATGT